MATRSTEKNRLNRLYIIYRQSRKDKKWHVALRTLAEIEKMETEIKKEELQKRLNNLLAKWNLQEEDLVRMVMEKGDKEDLFQSYAYPSAYPP